MQTNVTGGADHRHHDLSDDEEDNEETTLANTVKVREATSVLAQSIVSVFILGERDSVKNQGERRGDR